jgi:hypothetical protein
MPLGCLVNPFIACADRSQLTIEASQYVDDATKLARCDVCAAYINPHCDATHAQWHCSLCGHRNVIARSMTRYRHSDIRNLPETREALAEFPMVYRDIDGGDPDCIGHRHVSALERSLIHVLLIQDNMVLDAMQAVVEDFMSAIE